MDWLRSIGHKLSSLQKHDEKPQTLPPSAVSGLSKRDADPDASRPSDPTNADEPVACPYCDFVINPPPARSRKCPSCKQAIAMRSTYGSSPIWRDGVTRTRLFMTLEQAESFDAAAAEASSRMNAITTAQRFGCSTTDFTRKQASLHKASAENVSPQGVLLALLEDVLGEARERKDLQLTASVTWEKARTLYDLGRADFVGALDEHHRVTLVNLQSSQVVKGVAISSADCCLNCAKLEGKKMNIVSALSSSLLPQADCTRESENGERGWCICHWSGSV